MHAPRPITLTPAGIAATVLVFLVAAACVRLGFWQLDRLEQRRTANSGMEERVGAPTLALTSAPDDTAGLVLRSAQIRGTWDPSWTVALAGRSRAGAPGVHVLAPVRLEAGGALLVDRGFVPSADAATVSADLRPTGRADLTGRLMPFEPRAGSDGSLRSRKPGSATLPTWFARTPDGLGAHIPYPLAPLYVVAESPTGPGPYPAPSALPEPDDGPHLAYAIQWFSFGAIAIAGWAAMVLRGSRRAGERPEPRA